MSKKFRKALLFTAAVGSAAGALFYFTRKKLSLADEQEEDDYDDFSDDTAGDSDSSRSYVPLNSDAGETASQQTAPAEAAADTSETASFTPLADQMAEGKTEKTVEEFFDEEESSEEEPPITKS